MKKPNRRSKRKSTADSSSSPATGDDKPQEQQQLNEKRVDDLEKENEALKRVIEEPKHKLPNVSPTSVDDLRKTKEDDDSQKLHVLEKQVMEMKKRLGGRSQLSAQKRNSSPKQKNGEAWVLTQDEIQRLKAQKVHLLCKIKLESVQFRLSKASLEKEVLQLKKEQRRNNYEMRKLLALNEKQKLVLQRKTEEAAMATKRLKELIESRKASSHKTSGSKSGSGSRIQAIELELKIAARVEEIRSEYDRQMEEMADEVRKFEEEAETLRQENFRYLLQEKEVDSKVRDSELRDLKEEVVRLSNLINQLGMPKAQVHAKKQDVDLVRSSVSVGSSIEFMDTPESECSGGSNAMSGKFTPRVCCSCSKKSLCKTSKCECRAAASGCGTGCGCAASKCSNRGVLSIKVDDSLQQKVASDLVHVADTSETEKAIVTSQSAEVNNDCARIRKPLSEIGNTLVISSPIKPDQKMRENKTVTQVDIVDPSFSVLEIAEGPKKADKASLADIPTRLTRAKRSVVPKTDT
ncbi:hypothetical protein P3X46_021219 [Hevea brasiliensis]|uniref:Tesmin/TSO1-like CXC domain-containing protein n=1 Tax=Hevea brasiliensis TaxID=3981 RepID=A0ABQ9LGK6_HEVBR|nr:kinesin-like protein KIN-4C isoform X1 [Hevea brasiliensis]KAJ9166468.1 hypothetical protein P3X46_021219 [Hevea brasiliensis]